MRFNIPLVDRLTNPQPGMLRGSGLDTPGNLEAFSQRFDDGVKKVFSNDQVAQYVKFGSPKDSNSHCGIRAGRLTLAG